jgi:hypothetical protein
MALQIPATKLRLQPYINCKAAAYDGGQGLPDFSNPNFKMNNVFAVQKVSLKNERPGHFWRELGIERYRGAAPRPIVETYPGLPTYELTLERVVLYEGNLIEALGFGEGGHDVFYQDKPLVMAFELYQPPTTPNGSSTTTTFMYHGVWLKSNPWDFDITQDDLKMVQSIDMIAAGVIQA